MDIRELVIMKTWKNKKKKKNVEGSFCSFNHILHQSLSLMQASLGGQQFAKLQWKQ